jgi:hypothetical protein
VRLPEAQLRPRSAAAMSDNLTPDADDSRRRDVRPQLPRPADCNCQYLAGVHDIGCEHWESGSAWKLAYRPDGDG